MNNLAREEEERKRILLGLIHELRSFTEVELVQRFYERTGGKVSLGLGATIPGTLRELRDLGALSCEGLRYTVLVPEPDPLAALSAENAELKSGLEWALRSLQRLVTLSAGTAWDQRGSELAGFAKEFQQAKAALTQSRKDEQSSHSRSH